jgi:hypothetical protein
MTTVVISLSTVIKSYLFSALDVQSDQKVMQPNAATVLFVSKNYKYSADVVLFVLKNWDYDLCYEAKTGHLLA